MWENLREEKQRRIKAKAREIIMDEIVWGFLRFSFLLSRPKSLRHSSETSKDERYGPNNDQGRRIWIVLLRKHLVLCPSRFLKCNVLLILLLLAMNSCRKQSTVERPEIEYFLVPENPVIEEPCQNHPERPLSKLHPTFHLLHS